MAASKKIDRQSYQEAMRRFAAGFPGDPALNVILIDDYMLSGQLDEAHRTIDRLDQSVGGDPYLAVFHGEIFCRQNRFADAVAAARRAIAADRSMQSAYETLLRASLGAQDFSATTDALLALEQQFALNFRDLRGVAEYAEYVKSAEYPRWLKTHERAAAPK
jgi:predicted Zn-dependent protease